MDALSCTTNKYAHLLGQATCMILLMLYVAGTCAVAQTLGPRHATYIDGIVTYMKRFSAERDARMPFPQPAGQQLSEEIVLYLAASRNPMFTEELALSKQALRELRQLRADRAQPLADTSVQELVRGQDGVVLVRGSAEDGDIPALLLNGRIILGIIAGMSAQLSEPRGMDMKFMTLGFTHSELPYCVRVRRLQGVALVIPAPQCV
ncbi:MAG: hypothetical protein DCC65_10660 [Planctomycetota bacterium]|nr:MAG: hypothetical protein DCC65_10660 [Planctomycetota bacterium]